MYAYTVVMGKCSETMILKNVRTLFGRLRIKSRRQTLMREIRDEHSVETKRLKVGQMKASVHKNTVRLYLIEDTVRT